MCHSRQASERMPTPERLRLWSLPARPIALPTAAYFLPARCAPASLSRHLPACLRAPRRDACPTPCLDMPRRLAAPRPLPAHARRPACPRCTARRADLDKGAIIATATLFVELKFIRGCGKCGHIEDVVVDSTYRGLRLGLRVIEALMAAAEVRRGAAGRGLQQQQAGLCAMLTGLLVPATWQRSVGGFGAGGVLPRAVPAAAHPAAGGWLLQGDP